MQLVLFSILFFGVALSDLGGFYTCVIKGTTKIERALGLCLGWAAVVTAFYWMGVLSTSPFWVSMNSSISFCGIDFMLIYLFHFCCRLTDNDHKKNHTVAVLSRIFQIIALIDIVSLLVNPFTNHVMTFIPSTQHAFAHFVFEMHPAYLGHLIFCYVLVAVSFFVLLYHAFRTPTLYRKVYLRVIFFVLVVVALNALYLFYTSKSRIDLSVLFYSLLGYGIYYTVFFSGGKLAIEQVSHAIVDHLDQPMLVFDYQGRLFYMNPTATKLFPQLHMGEHPTLTQDFIEVLSVDRSVVRRKKKSRFYWTSPAPDLVSYICDYQSVYDKNNRQVAQSFVFTNNTLGIDPLTGFQTEQYFEMYSEEMGDNEIGPVGIAVCDLNKLALLNNVLGYQRGDDAIALQAKLMKKHLPASSVFIRLHDAKLGAICYGYSATDIKAALTNANDELSRNTDYSMPLKMDYAVRMLKEGESLREASVEAMSFLNTRKLLDKESNRSGILDSLRQMLSEIDSETEAHVQRTRIMGDNLAYNLGLSDYERDQLSLLCLFHDVGKVGIPSNILNKPSRLTPEEQAIMREHVQKGYRIARATAGLEIVAEAILHHHENWDGSGYPDGLKYEAIPVLSRIISVVDSYDAMVSDRPYHAGISSEEACKELVRCSGTQFDPYVVDAFVHMLGNSAVAEQLSSAGGQTDTLSNSDAQGSQESVLPAKAILVSPVRFSQYKLSGFDSRISDIDDMFETLTGYTAYDVEHKGLTQSDLLFDEDREAYWRMVREESEKGDTAYFEHRIRRKDGTGCYVYCIGIRAMENGVPITRIVITDITDSASMQQQTSLVRNRAMMSLRRLEESIQLDPLTGLMNRTAFRKSCERELMDHTQRCVVMMMDVDNFKKYNDTKGHPAGDELLIALASVLAQRVGKQGLVARMGGDEFCCLLKFPVDAALSKISEAVQGIWSCANDRLKPFEPKTTVSAGAVCAMSANVEFRDLYSQADETLYHAKQAGKNNLFTTWERH